MNKENSNKENKGLSTPEEEMLRNIAIGGDDAQITRTSEDVEKEKPEEVDKSDSEGQGTGNSSGSTDDDGR